MFRPDARTFAGPLIFAAGVFVLSISLASPVRPVSASIQATATVSQPVGMIIPSESLTVPSLVPNESGAILEILTPTPSQVWVIVQNESGTRRGLPVTTRVVARPADSENFPATSCLPQSWFCSDNFGRTGGVITLIYTEN
jgi:hypothetical protein